MNDQKKYPVENHEKAQSAASGHVTARKPFVNITEMNVSIRLIAALFGVIGLLGILNETFAECRQYLHYITWPNLWICWLMTAVSFFILGLFWATVLWEHEVKRRHHRTQQSIRKLNWRSL